MVKTGKGQWCAALYCKNNRQNNKNLSFFHFPRNPERSRQWVINCKREDLLTKDSEYLSKNCTLCRNHFDAHMFTSGQKNRLLNIAIPTIFISPCTKKGNLESKRMIDISLRQVPKRIKSDSNDLTRPLTPTFVSVSDADPFLDMKEDPDAIDPFHDTDVEEIKGEVKL